MQVLITAARLGLVGPTVRVKQVPVAQEARAGARHLRRRQHLSQLGRPRVYIVARVCSVAEELLQPSVDGVVDGRCGHRWSQSDQASRHKLLLLLLGQERHWLCVCHRAAGPSELESCRRPALESRPAVPPVVGGLPAKLLQAKSSLFGGDGRRPTDQLRVVKKLPHHGQGKIWRGRALR